MHASDQRVAVFRRKIGTFDPTITFIIADMTRCFGKVRTLLLCNMRFEATIDGVSDSAA